MGEIVIRRCVLRITRHGGRSWGADRHGLVERVTRLLPELIAARLAELLGNIEGEIVEPIRVRAKLNIGRAFGDSAMRESIANAFVSEILPAASKAAAEAAQPALAAEGGAIAAAGRALAPAQDLSSLPPGTIVRTLLLRWREQGDLLLRLRGFSDITLQAWLAAFVDGADRSPSAPDIPVDALAEEAAAIRERLAASPDIAGRADRLRLVLAVELAARHGRLPAPSLVFRILDDIASVTPAAGRDIYPSSGTEKPAPASRKAAAAATDFVARRASLQARPRLAAPPLNQDIRLCSVLPFVVLGMLRRIGWLKVAAATFDALALPDRGAVFATALAYKLLPLPQHGWYRDANVLRTASAFAGLAAAPSPLEFQSWCRDAKGGLSALDSFVATELANGHNVEEPLLIARVDNHQGPAWLLLDSDGLFPVAWATDEAALLTSLETFGPSVVAVSAQAATPALMRGLSAARRAFVTDARPARSEEWRRISGRSGLWASPLETPRHRLLAAAKRQAELEHVAAEINRELIELRPAGSRGEALDVERAALLAAATGLGMLAWTLWHEREPVDPLLALNRFGDLDGSARLTETAVEVRPAVGRRYLDMKDRQVLADIPGVPWLAGRTITFVGP
ncbi:hypothetical protein ACN2CC_26475 [Mesorhizobium muleiense]|uniref:hypothetical protein n=1 Tax=Mesorhizobium muleiense TaxID=1004279 RepID=UPI003AFB7F41